MDASPAGVDLTFRSTKSVGGAGLVSTLASWGRSSQQSLEQQWTLSPATAGRTAPHDAGGITDTACGAQGGSRRNGTPNYLVLPAVGRLSDCLASLSAAY